MKGQITACGFVTWAKYIRLGLAGNEKVKGQITACGFVTVKQVGSFQAAEGKRPDYRLRFCYYSTSNSLATLGKGERPDYRLRFCYFTSTKHPAINVTKVKGQITACGFVTR